MRLCVAIFLGLLPSVVLSQDSVYYLDPGPSAFTVQTNSYTGAIVAVSQFLGSDSGSLLQSPDVLDELELVDEQKTKLTSRLSNLARDYEAKSVELSKSFNGSPQSAEKLELLRVKYVEDVKATSEDILLPFQLDRLKQIRLQTEFRNSGSMAMESDSFTDLLKLTAVQKSELKAKSVAAEQKLRSDFQIERQKVHREVLEEVLTKKQLKTLDENLGKPMADVSK